MKWSTEEDDLIRSSYASDGPGVIASATGRTVKAVINRRYRLGCEATSDLWSAEDVEALHKAYREASFGEEIRIDELALRLGRTYMAVALKASKLGLGDISRRQKAERKVRLPMFSKAEDLTAYKSDRMKAWHASNPHPRGALGMKHSDETKAVMAEKSRATNATRSPEEKVLISLKAAKTKIANGTYAPERKGATWKAGWREIGGYRKYYRSKWEANYARYLEWLKCGGHIREWRHEPKTFWFSGVKRGTVSYLPDFWVVEIGGSEAFHEVKGWMDDRSKTKLDRMKRYYPAVTIVLIREKEYREIKRKLSSLIPGWEA